MFGNLERWAWMQQKHNFNGFVCWLQMCSWSRCTHPKQSMGFIDKAEPLFFSLRELEWDNDSRHIRMFRDVGVRWSLQSIISISIYILYTILKPLLQRFCSTTAPVWTKKAAKVNTKTGLSCSSEIWSARKRGGSFCSPVEPLDQRLDALLFNDEVVRFLQLFFQAATVKGKRRRAKRMTVK